MDDLNPESIWRFRIRGFGPLLVTMDSHGGSLHREVTDSAKSEARRDPGEHRGERVTNVSSQVIHRVPCPAI